MQENKDNWYALCSNNSVQKCPFIYYPQYNLNVYWIHKYLNIKIHNVYVL